jgi:hypothetical protein
MGILALLQFKWSTSILLMHCSVSSRGDLGELIRRTDTLELQAGNMQHSLEDHVVQSREWQQSVGAQLANFNTMMQQQQADWQAFHRYQDLIPAMSHSKKQAWGEMSLPPLR